MVLVNHDKTMLDKEQISQSLPHSIDVLVDKENNRIIVSFRMPVEHAIGAPMALFKNVVGALFSWNQSKNCGTFICIRNTIFLYLEK